VSSFLQKSTVFLQLISLSSIWGIWWIYLWLSLMNLKKVWDSSHEKLNFSEKEINSEFNWREKINIYLI
jgi:hypothetical protein